MIIKLSVQKPMSLMEFYEAVATEMGYTDTSEIKYDCTKINIAENIQDGFYDHYAQTAKETDPTLSVNDIKTGITMLLAMSGPKADTALKANEVEIFDGFIC
jgi:hypothetical protein